MIFDKNAIKIFGISCLTDTLREYDNYDVGDMLGNTALTFVWTDIEPTQSMTKSLKKLNIELYEGVGQILVVNNYGNYPTLLFDCGIYA
ncbi:MAG: hypothetical protein HQK99_08435, partial [Nitrospirae bacterium]|nr:hypothetical protein [Nitrospirota bacterium]